MQASRVYNTVHDLIVEQLNENTLLNHSQHGFRQHTSCLTNLLEFLDLEGSLSATTAVVLVVTLLKNA